MINDLPDVLMSAMDDMPRWLKAVLYPLFLIMLLGSVGLAIYAELC